MAQLPIVNIRNSLPDILVSKKNLHKAEVDKEEFIQSIAIRIIGLSSKY